MCVCVGDARGDAVPRVRSEGRGGSPGPACRLYEASAGHHDQGRHLETGCK